MSESPKVFETQPDPTSTAQTQRAMTLILFLAGVAACCVLYPRFSTFNPWSSHDPQELAADALAERILLFIAAGLALIPATRRLLFNLIFKLKNPSPASARCNSVAIAILAIPLLYWLAVSHGKILLPGWHDENYYRLQTTMLAHGKLCMPALPLPDFLTCLCVHAPVYSSMYFPGTSLLHVPGVWFHLPYCAIPLAIAGATLALLYLIVTELIDGVAGLLAVALMLSLQIFRFLAVVEMSHAAGALWGLTAIAAWLAWRKSKALRWVLLAGIAAGWYAITRPLDAVCVLLPIALVWGWELRREPMKVKAISLAVVIVAMAPFVGLQLAFDRAVTGHALQTPVSMYYRMYLNVRGFGLEKYDPNFSPPTQSMLVRDTYLGNRRACAVKFQTIRQATMQWFTDRLPMSFAVGLPSLLLIVLYPVGLLQLTDRRRAVFWSIFWFYMAGSALVFIFLTQYLMAVAPAIIFSVLLGARAIKGMPCAKWRRGLFVDGDIRARNALDFCGRRRSDSSFQNVRSNRQTI